MTTTPPPPSTPRHLYSLDALRGAAALAIVFWHWQHFFFIGDRMVSTYVRAEQPLYAVFFLFYQSGSLAVELFFSLSGFIFFWLYADAVTERRISWQRFSVLRLSRLYPLHITTLFVVLAAQALYNLKYGAGFVYQHNDAYHFGLNLLMLTSVGLERGNSFNAPFWSVSVEVCLYAIFFGVCWLARPRAWLVAALSLLGFFVVHRIYAPIALGAGSFFLGGCVFMGYRGLVTGGYLRSATLISAAVMLALWGLTIYLSAHQISLEAGTFLEHTSFTFAAGVLFPVTILTLALLETRFGPPGRGALALGNISYSSYLWHFPLQLIFVLCTASLGLTSQWFTTPASLAIFFAVLIAVSAASHRYLERPAQAWMRRTWADGSHTSRRTRVSFKA